jgi:rhamnogalacturonyl hydrolase YesR
MKKVADWQIGRVRDGLSTDWTFAVLEAGLVSASDTLGDPVYRNAVKAMGDRNGWRLGPRQTHGDDQVVGQSYLAIYARERKPEQIAPVKKQFETLKGMPSDPQKPVWWWCDALFMAPPVWAELSHVAGDRSYLDYMDREWWITSALLYDQQEHLFSRDAKYLDRKEANGKKVFWLRGNGWVMGGLVRVLRYMPADYPSRPKYVRMFSEMAQKMASLQGKDGLWRTGLLNQDAYPLPETSGSALATYALAWGVNHGLLDRAVYMPVIARAWGGLVSHIYDDGRLGCVQPVGERPDPFRPTSSYVYGVGAFLLAGSEMYPLADLPKQSKN